ncbi:hypothetical protein MTO96_003000 [Rhipicephalus appendiculatus]
MLARHFERSLQMSPRGHAQLRHLTVTPCADIPAGPGRGPLIAGLTVSSGIHTKSQERISPWTAIAIPVLPRLRSRIKKALSPSTPEGNAVAACGNRKAYVYPLVQRIQFDA